MSNSLNTASIPTEYLIAVNFPNLQAGPGEISPVLLAKSTTLLSRARRIRG